MELASLILSSSHEIVNITKTEESGGHNAGDDHESDVIFFIFSSLCLGGIVKEINKKTSV